MHEFNELENRWNKERFPSSVILWSDNDNCSPVEDLRAWQKNLANMCGVYGNKIEFNYKTFKILCESSEYLRLGYDKIVVPYDLAKLLWSEPKIIINDEISNGKILIKSHSKFTEPWYKDLEATVF